MPAVSGMAGGPSHAAVSCWANPASPEAGTDCARPACGATEVFVFFCSRRLSVLVFWLGLLWFAVVRTHGFVAPRMCVWNRLEGRWGRTDAGGRADRRAKEAGGAPAQPPLGGQDDCETPPAPLSDLAQQTTPLKPLHRVHYPKSDGRGLSNTSSWLTTKRAQLNDSRATLSVVAPQRRCAQVP